MLTRFTDAQIARINEKALRMHAEAIEQEKRDTEAKRAELHEKYGKKYEAMMAYWRPLVSPELLQLVVPFEDYAARYRGQYEDPYFFHVDYGGVTYHIEHHRNADGSEFFQIKQSEIGNRKQVFSAEAAEAEVWARIGYNVAQTMAVQAIVKNVEAKPAPAEPSLDDQIGGTLTVIEDYIEDSYANYDKIRSMQEGYGRLHYLMNGFYLPNRHMLTREAMETFIAIAVTACRTIIDLGAAGGSTEEAEE